MRYDAWRGTNADDTEKEREAMLTREENELMCQTGPGTPMGEFCRRFWTPVLLSEELPEPDCPPVQTKIYSEHLVAFRDTSGRVGVLGGVLSPPAVQPLLRSQRGRRTALHLPRLEV